MAEMLVRLFDKYHGEDLHMIAKSYARGDVIVVAEDGWGWASMERSSYNWIILKVDATIQKCNTLRIPEQGNPNTELYLRILAFYLDLDALTLFGYSIPTAAEAEQGRQLNQSRAVEQIVILETDMDAVKRKRPKLPDPAIIG